MNTPRPTPETDAVLVNHMPKGATEWSDHYVTMCIHSRKLERERDEAREQIEAMREAIKEAYQVLQAVPVEYDSRFFRAGKWTEAALAKLQPFLAHE